MRSILRLFFNISTIFVFTSFLHSQTHNITGNIYDLKTNEPIPFATVKVIDNNSGTTSDENGYYILKIDNGLHKVVFSYIGYFSDTALINIEGNDAQRDIYLTPSEILIEEITIAGEDPAYEIIRRAIQYKKQFQKNLEQYEYDAYSKFVLRSNQGSVQTEITSDNKYGILAILESQTKGYFKKPDFYKEVVVAKKETANTTRGVALPFIVNFYDEDIELGETSIPGPLSDDAFDSYDYKLIGTTSIDSLLIYKIRVTNQSNLVPQFFGEIYISDSVFALMKVDLTTNNAANIRGITEVNFRQKFSNYTDSKKNEFWMPTDNQIFANGSFAGFINFNAEVYSVVSSYKMNEPLPRNIFDEYIIKVMPDANKDSAYWTQNQLIKNSTEENKAYEKIEKDEKKKEKEFNFGLGGIKLGKYISSNPLNYYHFNRVEGNYLQLDANYRNKFGKDVLDTYFGYGFSDKKAKYEINYTKRLLRDRSLFVSVSFFDKLKTLSADPPGISEFTNTVSSLFFKTDYYDYYYANGYRFGISYSFLPQIRTGISLGQEKQQTAYKNTNFSIFKSDQDFKENPPINDAFTRKIGLNFRVDPNKFKFIDWGDGDISRIRMTKFPILRFGMDYSGKDFLKSTYEFRKFYASLTGSAKINVFFNPSFRITGEYLTGDVPFQELSYFNTSTGVLNAEDDFKTPAYQEFLGDKLYSINIENDFGKILWGNIPVLKEFDLIGFYNAGRIDISDANKQLAAYKSFSGTDGIFQEAGFGIGSILGVFRLDFAWRLNNFRSGENFKIVLSSLGL